MQTTISLELQGRLYNKSGAAILEPSALGLGSASGQQLNSSSGLGSQHDANGTSIMSLSINDTQLFALDNNLNQLEHLDLLAEATLDQTTEMAIWEQTIWVILFFSMVLVASSGNMIVVYIVSTNKEMKSVTNYFLVNLSVADTMVSMLNVVFNFISMLRR